MKLKIALMFILVLFISIFLHEMGHALAFRHNGLEVEKVSTGAVWEARLTVFIDSRGTEYEIGPLPLLGYTRLKNPEEKLDLNLAKKAEVQLAGVAVNALIVLFLTPWYFLLRRKRLFLGTAFRFFIILNFLLLVTNVLIVLPFFDGGKLLYFILSQWLGDTFAFGVSLGLGFISLLLFFFGGFKHLLKKLDKIYGRLV